MVPSIHEPTPEKANTSVRFKTGATPKSSEKPSAEPGDIFSPTPKSQNASTRSKRGILGSERRIFSSARPLNLWTMLDEMNKRLAEEGVEVVDVNVSIPPKKQ